MRVGGGGRPYPWPSGLVTSLLTRGLLTWLMFPWLLLTWPLTSMPRASVTHNPLTPTVPKPGSRSTTSNDYKNIIQSLKLNLLKCFIPCTYAHRLLLISSILYYSRINCTATMLFIKRLCSKQLTDTHNSSLTHLTHLVLALTHTIV